MKQPNQPKSQVLDSALTRAAQASQNNRTVMSRLMLVMLLLLTFAGGAKADEVTVCNGTATNMCIPVYGTYADTQGSTSEFIIPSTTEGMNEMTGATISKLTFYLESPADAAWTSTFQVYMDEVDNTTLSGVVGPSACTVVYTGTLDATGSTMEIVFDTPYTYEGGNLLIGTYVQTNTSVWKSAYFCGVEAQGTGYCHYSSINSAQNFIPKTTFTYTPGSGAVYYRPKLLTLNDVTATTATISWTAPTTTETITGYAYQYKKASDGDDAWSAEATVTTTSASLTALTANTAYNFRVKTLYGTNESRFVSMNFTTDCEAITTFPWSEDFESYSTGNFANPCWVNEHIEGSGNKIFTISTNTNGTNSTHQLQLPDQSDGTMTMLRLPVMTLPQGTNYQFVLDVYRNNNSNSKTEEGIRVFASADGNISGATELAFIPRVCSVASGDIPAEGAAGWYTYELPIGFTGTCYIILRGESKYGAATYMDNFVVEETPACLKPVNLNATNVTTTSAMLSWTEKGDATNWVLQCGTDKTFTDGTYTEVNVSDTPSQELTGLTTETVYYARVKAVKGNDEGEWSKICSFWPTATEEIAVNDGTNTNSSIPFSGYYVNHGAPNKSQFIITADQLEDVNPGSTIKGMTLHSATSYSSANWGNATFNVYLKEVSESSFADATFVEDGLATVYQGELAVGDSKMEIIFDQDFTYHGGNLLVGFELTEAGISNILTWIGVNSSGNSTVYTYKTSSTSQKNPELSTFMPKVSFRFLQAALACDRPKNLVAANITHEQATITWTSEEDAWNIAWSTDPDFDPEAQTTTSASNVSEKTYTITGLNPLTDYYVAVQSACGGDWSRKMHFKTIAVAVVVGDSWSNDFEGTECGWELINGELTNAWTWGTATSNGGTHALYISNDGGSTNAYTNNSATMVYAIKLLSFTDGKYEFSYDWQAYGEYSWDYMRVFLVPATETLTAGSSTPSGFSATALPTGWIALDGGSKLNLADTWQEETAFVKLVAGNYFLVVAWRNDGSHGNNPPAAIDNVSISRMACSADVENLAASNVTTNSAQITWTADEATQWQVAYSTSSTFENATEVIVNTASYNLTGLQIGSYYYVKVRAYCGGSDFGTWSEVLKFNTEVETITAYPWTENFDSYTGVTSGSTNNLPIGWHYINTCTYNDYSGYPVIYNSSSYSHSGNNHLRFDSYQSSYTNYDPQDQYAILPEMESLSGKRIKLYARKYYSSYDATFSVGIMTDPTDATTFTEIATCTPASITYEPFSVLLNAYTGSGTYIAIKMAAASGGTNHVVLIDDITVQDIPTCLEPSYLAATDITAHTATLSWTNGEEGQDAWQICLNDDETNLINANSNPFTLTGLNAKTTYTAKVRAYCSVTDQSEWSDPVSFTTVIACPIPTGLVVSAVGPNFATLNWNSHADSWQICVNGDEEHPIDVTDKTYTLTGLTTETDYAVKVRGYFGNDGYSSWTTDVNFTTLVSNPVPADMAVSNITSTAATVGWTGYGDSYNVRYKKKTVFPEDFEGGTMPDGWTVEGDNQDASTTWRVGVGDDSNSTGTHSGEKNVLITHKERNNETYLITPAMNFSGLSDLTLSFWYINRNWSGDIDGLGVYYRVNGGAWNELWSTTEAHETWTNQTVALTGLDANYQIGFKMTDDYGKGVGLDDIDIANLDDWVTVADLTEKSTDITGLTPNTQYVCQVQSVKGGTTTDWSKSAFFTTLGIIELADNDSAKPDGEKNADLISDNNGVKTDVTLAGRTLWKDGGWNTLCLPFNLTISGSVLDGDNVDVRTLSSADYSNGTMTLNFTDKGAVTKLVAGTPYIIKWSKTNESDPELTNLASPTFTGVTISNTTANAETSYVDFKGTYSPVTYDSEDRSILFLGTENKLHYPQANASINAFRAYFELKNGLTAGDTNSNAPVQNFVLNFGDSETTGIVSHPSPLTSHLSGWYDLSGRKLNGKPTQKGVYIFGNKQVVIK